jgi:hypothetical protein
MENREHQKTTQKWYYAPSFDRWADSVRDAGDSASKEKEAEAPKVNLPKNHFTLDFDGETLMIRINGKLVAAYPKRDLTPVVLHLFFERMETIFRRLPDGGSFEGSEFGFQIPSVGPCTLCDCKANLLGGLCWDCIQKQS